MPENREIDAEQIEQELRARIRRHRRFVALRTLILIGVLITACILLYRFFNYHVYTTYEVRSSVDRDDTPATHFRRFSGGLLKYSNDGAFYQDMDNKLIWNQTFEMEDPEVDICGDYVALADVGGTDVFLIDKEGNRAHLETTIPVFDFSISEHGTTALLLSGKNEFYLRLYGSDGEELASGELFVKNSGFPLDVEVSPDGQRLALSAINPEADGISSTITFYNFGAVGQNEQDHIVGTYTYEDTVFPELSYSGNDTLTAFGDQRILTFSGKQKPEPDEEMLVEGEIKSLFYNEDYFGLIFNTGDKENTRCMKIYDKHLKEVLEQTFVMDYDTAEFLPDGEICLKSDLECALFNMHGVERFRYTFDKKLLCIMPEHLGIFYTFLMEGSAEKVMLK